MVLAGGRSSRMGTPKACLDWHGSTLLYRTVALLRRTVAGPVVVVVGADDLASPLLPALPAGVTVVQDPTPGLGPLQGIAGVSSPSAPQRASPPMSPFVCATDMPFLHPAFVRAVLAALTDPADVALPVARGHRQPLAAAYRVGLAGSVATLLAEGGRTPGELFARCRVTVLDDDALCSDPAVTRLDPGLESLTNVNTPAEYAAARARPPGHVIVESGGARHTVRPRRSPGRRTRSGRASMRRSSSTASGSHPTRTSRSS